MTVEVDDAGRSDQAVGTEPLLPVQVGSDPRDPARGDGDIDHGVERAERVDRPAARDDEVGATALDMPADCGFAFEFELR